MIYQRVRGRIGGRVMSGLNGQHSGRAGMLSGVAAAIAGMTLNWASSPGNLLPPGFSLTRASQTRPILTRLACCKPPRLT